MVLGVCGSIAAVIGLSAIQGDEAVLNDIDRHFRAYGQASRDSSQLDESQFPENLAIAGSPLATSNGNGKSNTVKSGKTNQVKERKRNRNRFQNKSKQQTTVTSVPNATGWRGIRNVGPQAYEINEPLANAARKSPMKFVR